MGVREYLWIIRFAGGPRQQRRERVEGQHPGGDREERPAYPPGHRDRHQPGQLEDPDQVPGRRLDHLLKPHGEKVHHAGPDRPGDAVPRRGWA